MSIIRSRFGCLSKFIKTYFTSPYTTVSDQNGRPLTILSADVEHFYAEQARVIATQRQEREQALARQAAADLMAGTRRTDH